MTGANTGTGTGTRTAAPFAPDWRVAIDDVPIALATTTGAVAVAGADGTVSVLDAADGAERGRIALDGGALTAAWAPGGATLAVGGPTGRVLWDRRTGTTHRAQTGRWCGALAWADAHRLALGSGRRAEVVDAEGVALWSTADVASTVTAVHWLQQGRRLAVAAYGGVSCFLPGRRAPVVDYRFTGSLLTLAVAPSEKWLASGNQDASIHIWRTRDGDELEMGGYPAKVTRLAFDDTSRWLAADGSPDVTVWDFTGKGNAGKGNAGKGPAGTAPRVFAVHDAVTALAWRPGSEAVLGSGGREGTVALWRASRGLPSRPQRPWADWPGGYAVTDIAWASADRLVAAFRDGSVRGFAAVQS